MIKFDNSRSSKLSFDERRIYWKGYRAGETKIKDENRIRREGLAKKSNEEITSEVLELVNKQQRLNSDRRYKPETIEKIRAKNIERVSELATELIARNLRTHVFNEMLRARK